jgi:hypothetical protein
MINRIRLLILFALVFGLVPSARAQYIWRMTHGDLIGKYLYAPTAIDCYGQTCTVAVLKSLTTDTNFSKLSIHIIFLRSDDGGVTWTEQDSGLPGLKGTYQNQINVIQQIDSLDAIACGDSSLILRTSDGGSTWEQQHLDSNIYTINSVHFSDPMTGIITHYGYHNEVSITTDGGENWVGVTMPQPYIYSASHSYGGGSFSVMIDYYDYRLYSTHDYWNTVDSSSPIVTLDSDNVVDAVNYCDFSSGDTIIAYGQRYYEDSNRTIDSSINIMVRTTDAGNSWVETLLPFKYPANIVSMTPLDRDTVFSAGGGPSGGMILESVNRGATWFQDSIILDTAFSDLDSYSPGMSITGDGHPIALLTQVPAQNMQGIIIRRESTLSGVAEVTPVVQSEQMYPNPFSQSTQITFTSQAAGYAEVSIVNMLGVEVARLFSGELGAGEHSFTWDAGKDACTTGTYECLVRMNGRVETLPVVLMR